MNQGVVRSSVVQQMAAAGSPNWWSINNNNMQPPPHHQHHSLLAALPHNHIPHQLTPPLFAPPSWTDSQNLPQSWSQLLLGLVGEEDKPGMCHMQPKNLENWEQQLLNHTSNSSGGDEKQENSPTSYTYCPGNIEFPTASKSTNFLSPQIVSASPSKTCIATSSMRTSAFSFSNKSSEMSAKCNSSNSTGGAAKKAKIQASSAQSGIKVRKEKLGDRITALHQLVSPFGKTDTASVLLEAIGYIRFLQRQIEALSLPYLNSGSGNMTHQQPVKRKWSCLFPEDPGQLLNESHIKRKAISDQQECDEEEPKKDLKSRGLCLVPISCTVDVGSENGADFWAPAFGGNFQ